MSLLTDASLIVTPNAYKAGTLYSVIPNTTLGDMTVVRATTATRVNSAGLIESVAINVPRLDYPPLGGCPSILVEPARTNLVPNGLGFNSATGVLYDTTVIGSPAIGINSARITKNEVSGTTRYANQNCSTAALLGSTTYTLSRYFKYDGHNTTTSMEYNSSLQWGTISWSQQINIAATGITLGASSFCTSTIQNAGNGWYRVNVTITTGALITGTPPVTYLMILQGALSVGQGFLTALPQLEAGSYATSYIPTTTAAVPRDADVISKTGVSSLIGQTEGTLFVDVNFEAESVLKNYLTLGNSGSFYISILARATNKIGMEVLNSSVQVNVSSTSTYTTNQRLKIAMTYKSNDFKLYVNGVLQVTDTGGTVPATGAVILGSSETSISQATDGINLAILWKTALTDDQCILLTGPSFSSYPEMASALIYTLQ